MNFRHPRHRIQEIIDSAKCLSEGHTLEVKARGEDGARFDVSVDLKDGPYCDLRYLGRAGRSDVPETYDASFLLDQQRVRGIGYCPVGRQNFRAKLRISAGWHQNICDPNVPTDHPEWNRHVGLSDFTPTDFADFVRLAATMWNIDVGWETELL